MKKFISLILCSILIISMSISASAATFKGASNWAIPELERANGDGFITDRIASDFSQKITREEFCEIAVILYDRLGGNQNLESYNPFTDTTNPNVIKAFNAEIIKGISDDKFAPDANLTREQLCVMLIRAMDSAGIIFGNENNYTFQKEYADIDEISSWAYTHVKIMNDFRIMNGTGDDLEPKAPITREQAVIMLERTYLREFEIEENLLIGYLGNSSDVIIPSGVIKVDDDVFHNNAFVQRITLSNSVEEVGYASFRNMKNLIKISLNEGLEEVGEAAFELCENLENVILPSTLETISFMAFQDCLSFTKLTIPSSVNYIDDQGFYRCENLAEVIFEGDVEYIGESAFEECVNVTFVCDVGTSVEAYAIEHNIPVSYK